MGTIRMTDAAVQKVVRRFNRTADDLEGARGDVRTVSSTVEIGAGEFSGAIRAHADAFELSWLECLDLFADSARIIAGNTGQLKVDLDRVDGTHAAASGRG